MNNDDENCADVSTAVQFHNMMYDLGYRTTVCPYTNWNFWNSLVSQLGGRCDRVLIQCYDGGANNNPSDWHLNNVTLHAGRTNYQSDMNTSINQMQAWKNNNGVTGGFVWVYNDETWNLNAWATAMNRIFGVKTTDRGVATFCRDSDFGGYNISLPEGEFTQADLALYGITGADVSSLRILPGYKVTLYSNIDLTGSSNTWTSDANYLGDWNDRARSIRIEPNGVSGKSGIYKVRNRNSGKYLDLDANSVADNTAIVQWDDEGTEAYQQWRFIEVGAGVYSIQALAGDGRGLDVAYGSVNNSTQVLLFPYYGGYSQQFILVDKGDDCYQFVARHCGKVVEIPNSSTVSGEWIRLWDNNGAYTQQWRLEHNRLPGEPVATLYQDVNYGGYSGDFSEGSFNTMQMLLFGIQDNDVTSLKVKPGFKVTCYADDNFGGESISYTADNGWVGNEWNDRISSIKIEASGTSGLGGKYKLQGCNSQLFWDFENATTATDAMLVQKAESSRASQEFRFTEIGDGVYSIRNLNSGKYIDVLGMRTDNWADIGQAPHYPENKNQQWIAFDKGDGYYQLVARHCGKVIEVPYDRRNDGEELKTFDNNNQTCSWGKVGSVSDTYDTDLTDNGGSKEVSLVAIKDEEGINMLFDNDPNTKYCAKVEAGATIWMLYESTELARITSYSLTSANDAQKRDPKSWTLQGSNDGETWETIDSRSDEIFPERFQRKTYEVSTDESYGFFRLEVTEQYENTSVFQLAEWQLFGVTTGIFDPTGVETLEATDANGLVNIYNMNGQLMKRGALNTNGLPTGVYIINRRKVVVK